MNNICKTDACHFLTVTLLALQALLLVQPLLSGRFSLVVVVVVVVVVDHFYIALFSALEQTSCARM